MTSQHLAIDLGAESGRVIAGTISGEKLELSEIRRFPTKYTSISGSYRWDVHQFFKEILEGLKAAAKNGEKVFGSIGIDSWGVDYALLAKDGNLLGLPHSYRDPRTGNAIDEFKSIMDLDKLYRLTGNQIIQINTLFQLLAEKKNNPDFFKIVTDLLFIPDLFNYFLTGIKKTEFTFATTSQLYNPLKNQWEPDIFRALGIDIGIMQEIISPCSVLGNLSAGVSRQVGLAEIPLVAIASHDTSSAIAAIPAEGRNWAYISSGTWALVGFENPLPVINDLTLKYNFTNEGGIKGFNILKNMPGFWLLQECRRIWGEQEYTHENLVETASEAKEFPFFIDTGDAMFLNPVNMPQAIEDFCMKTGQQKPASKASIVRAILESLALKTNSTIHEINKIKPEPVEKIYITGGGVRNRLFCQFTANATGLEVIAVLPEGAAAGNILAQAIALGTIRDPEHGRQVVQNSIEPAVYLPMERGKWENAFKQYLEIIAGNNAVSGS